MTLPNTPGEPLRLADGRMVMPGGAIIDNRPQPQQQPHAQVGTMRDGGATMVEIPSNREAQRLIMQTRRKLSDLPEVPKTMNAINVVLAYTLFGLDDVEIALALNMTEQQITNIRSLEAYVTMHGAVVSNIMDTETDDVRDIFRQHARTAARVLVDGLHNGNRGDRIVAAKDFLDRSGHRPSDVVNHNLHVDGGLVIEIVRRDASVQVPTIDVDVLGDTQ